VPPPRNLAGWTLLALIVAAAVGLRLVTVLTVERPEWPYQPVAKVRPRRGRIFSAISALPNLGILAVFLRFGALI